MRELKLQFFCLGTGYLFFMVGEVRHVSVYEYSVCSFFHQIGWSSLCQFIYANKFFNFIFLLVQTSEEASGTTGFVRCLTSNFESEEQRTLDTSSNARLYQCCLFWQSPNLPAVTLFPRKLPKSSISQGGFYGSDSSISLALRTEW